MTSIKNNSSKNLPWNLVEKAIYEESKWLRNNLSASPFRKDNHNFGLGKKYIYRRLAILIVSGKIKARDIKTNSSLWKENEKMEIGKKHGEAWHSSMMEIIGGYFQSLNYKVVTEPTLNIGRADLGVYKKDLEKNLYIEVGTISLTKLLVNLESMKNSILLIVPDAEHAIEFSVVKANYKQPNESTN